MATLPADRTKLALAQANQTPGLVADASANKNALTEAYDTVDLLYQFLNQTLQGIYDSGKFTKLGIINVKDAPFNAKGDGVSDDTAAIQRALDSGSYIFLPQGTYLISNNIFLRSNTVLTGVYNSVLQLRNAQIQIYQNSASNIKLINLDIQFDSSSTTNFDMVNFTGKSSSRLQDITIRDCRIDGKNLGTGGIYVQYVDRINIVNNKIQNTGNADGVVIYDSNDIRIKNNDIRFVGRSGIKLFTNCVNVVIEDNFVNTFMLRREVSDGGIDSYGPSNSNVRIANNTVDTGTTAAFTTGRHTCIRVAGSTDYIVKNNICIGRSTTMNAMLLLEDRVGTYSDHVIASDNILKVQANTSYVIRVNGCDRSRISSNKIEITAGITIGTFIEVRSNAKHVIFTNNEIDMQSVSAHIITVFSGITVSKLKVNGNTIINATSLLLSANGGIVSEAIVNDNHYTTSGANALYFYTTIAKIIATGNILNSASTTIANQNNGTTVQNVANNLVTA